MRQVCAAVGGRWRETTETVHRMIAVGELLNKGKEHTFKLFPGVAQGSLTGNTTGNSENTPNVAAENPTGNRAAIVGQQSGNTTGNSGVAVLPTPIQGCGQQQRQTPGRKPLPVDLERWPGDPRCRVAELERGGMKPAEAMAKVRAEHGDEAEGG